MFGHQLNTQQYLSDRIERVQKKFTRVLCYRSNIDYKSFDYIYCCSFFNLQTLSSRRQICDLIYLHKILLIKLIVLISLMKSRCIHQPVLWDVNHCFMSRRSFALAKDPIFLEFYCVLILMRILMSSILLLFMLLNDKSVNILYDFIALTHCDFLIHCSYIALFI